MARSIARAESNDAVPSAGDRSNEARGGLLPTVPLQRLPSQRRNPASQHCEYRERRLKPALEVSAELLRLP